MKTKDEKRGREKCGREKCGKTKRLKKINFL